MSSQLNHEEQHLVPQDIRMAQKIQKSEHVQNKVPSLFRIVGKKLKFLRENFQLKSDMKIFIARDRIPIFAWRINSCCTFFKSTCELTGTYICM